MHSSLVVAILLYLTSGVTSETCAGSSLHVCGTIDSCNETLVTGLCSGGDDNICCLAGDVSPCSAQSGTCVKESNCDPIFGTTLSGLCPGDSSVKVSGKAECIQTEKVFQVLCTNNKWKHLPRRKQLELYVL